MNSPAAMPNAFVNNTTVMVKMTAAMGAMNLPKTVPLKLQPAPAHNFAATAANASPTSVYATKK